MNVYTLALVSLTYLALLCIFIKKMPEWVIISLLIVCGLLALQIIGLSLTCDNLSRCMVSPFRFY